MIKNNRHRPSAERIEIHEVTLENGHDWVVLKGTEKARIGKYYHETAKADLYVALQAYCDFWIVEYPLGDGALVPDITMDFMGTRFHVEVDLGNEKPDDLLGKVDRYVYYAGDGEKVIIALRDGKYRASQTGSYIIQYCQEKRLGNFVTATFLDTLLKRPTDEILVSPKEGRISILSLCPSPINMGDDLALETAG
jgi:hypothetical protein